MTVRFPAFCPSCGLIFPGAFAIEGFAHNITLEGNRERCPRCGAWAELPDGTFDVLGDTIHVLSASGLTRERLLRLKSLLEAARSGAMPDEAAVQAVVAEAPSLAPLIERFRPVMGKALIFFLTMVIQIIVSQGVQELRDDSATRADVQRAVEQAIRDCQEQGP